MGPPSELHSSSQVLWSPLADAFERRRIIEYASAVRRAVLVSSLCRGEGDERRRTAVISELGSALDFPTLHGLHMRAVFLIPTFHIKGFLGRNLASGIEVFRKGAHSSPRMRQFIMHSAPRATREFGLGAHLHAVAHTSMDRARTDLTE